ncbi:MAG: Hpt domain-containing protein [Pseudanabaena sp. ELA607]
MGENTQNQDRYLVNLPYLHEISGNDLEIEKELFQIYFEDTYQRLATIQHCIINDDSKRIGVELHHLKGSSGNVGIEQIATLVKNLEKEYQSQNIDNDKILGQIKNIYHILDRVKLVVNEHYGDINI